jgi:protein-L-isoaspartate(D-aspartate) O-methyltransferase
MTGALDSAPAALLRDRLADLLVFDGAIESAAVEAAFRAVPRHLFAPGATLEEAYAPDRVVTKRDGSGVTISSVSAPQIQAQMLEQAALGTGMRVLEIGSGGYNAALIAEIVGPAGEVTTVDIDPEVAERARRCLRDAGYERVEVLVADGEDGCGQRAPFDQIVVTAGAWDIPPAWADQLAGDGIIIVPLRMRGLTRSLALAPADGHLTARSARLCGFVDMQGAGTHREHAVWTSGRQIGLRFDDGQPPEAGLLDAAFNAGRARAWSGVPIAPAEPFDSLQLWLATALDGFCLATVDNERDNTLTRPANRIVSPAAVDGQSFGYLTVRRADETTVEFGAEAFGPEAAALAETIARQVREWDRSHRSGPGPQIAAYPARTPRSLLPRGLVIDKRHVRITISWPTDQCPAAGQDLPA